MWKINILTLQPEIYPGPLRNHIYNKVKLTNASTSWELSVKDIKDFTMIKHKTVDSAPFGGGGGMLLRPDVVSRAIQHCFLVNSYPIIYMSPKGSLFDQKTARSIVQSNKGINILCGRFEGIDERLIEEYSIREVSVGDYVLSSGDIAAFTFIDCCLRYVAGYLGNKRSLREESFGENEYINLLEYPHYTRPAIWKSRAVPEILTSGKHEEISEWRLSQAKKTTQQKRPDLWQKYLNGVNDESS